MLKTLRARAIAHSVLFSFVVLMLAAISLFSLNRLGHQMKDNELIANAVQSHMQADMMHDALRGDVLRALRIGPTGPEDEKKEAAAELQEHIESFRQSIEENAARPLPEKITRALTAIREPLDAYIKEASQIGTQAFVSADAGSRYGAFQKAFETLETGMENLSDQLHEELTTTTNDARRYSSILFVIMAGVGVLGLIISLLVALATRTGLIEPLVRLTRCTLGLAEGDKTGTIPGLARKDELGDMARAIEIFRQNAERLDVMEREKAERAQAARDENGKLREEVSGVVEAVSSAATELYACADSLSQMAALTSSLSGQVNNSMEEGARSLQTIASASEQMAGAVEDVCRQVTETSTAMENIVEKAKTSSSTMQALASAAGKIDDVVQLIRDIASQTNLLALNASIEAARAGDAGKGFAVVAQSVKALADQTAKATVTITDEIKIIQDLTLKGVDMINGINSVITNVNQISQATAASVEQQAVTTQQIASNLQEVNGSIAHSRQGIAQVNESANQSGASAAELQSASRELSIKAEQMRSIVDSFLSRTEMA